MTSSSSQASDQSTGVRQFAFARRLQKREQLTNALLQPSIRSPSSPERYVACLASPAPPNPHTRPEATRNALRPQKSYASVAESMAQAPSVSRGYNTSQRNSVASSKGREARLGSTTLQALQEADFDFGLESGDDEETAYSATLLGLPKTVRARIWKLVLVDDLTVTICGCRYVGYGSTVG